MTADIEALKSDQGANITYLRHMAGVADVGGQKVLSGELYRACDDIEAYREIVGFLLRAEVLGLNKEDQSRFEGLVGAMTWGNDFGQNEQRAES